MTQLRLSDLDIHPQFLQRWSPRSFTGKAISQDHLSTILEAARWAPSANNSQPWRFIYVHRDTHLWPAWLALLAEKNQLWAKNAAAFIVLISKKTHLRNGELSQLRSHSFDTGAAWMSVALQAQHLGWYAHAIGGFDKEKARQLLVIPEDYHLETLITIGEKADAEQLPEELKQREKPNQRVSLDSLVSEGSFRF